MKRMFFLLSGSAAAIGCALAAPACAQEASTATRDANAQSTTSTATADQANAADVDTGDIVVTANRREERLSRVGVTVTAVGAAELANQGIADPADLVKVIPGFQATTSYGGQPNYTLRGVGFAARYASATSPVGLYMNEAAVPYPYMSLGLLFDLERVEALKGPQGTLYGRNATGGLLNFISAKPTSTFQGGVSFDVGNYQTINSSAYVSGPLSDDVRVRLAVDTQNRNQGWQQSVTRGERLGALHQHAARLSVDFGNGGPLDVSIVGNYWRRYGDSQAPQAISYILNASPFSRADARASIIANPTSDTQADFLSLGRQPSADVGIIHPAPLIDSEYYDVTGRAALTLTKGVQLVSLTSYNHLRQRDVDDAAGLQTESIYQDSNSRIRSISEELRLVGESDRFNWSVGGYYAKDNGYVYDLGYADENAVVAQLRYLAQLFNARGFTPQQIARSFVNYQNRETLETSILAGFANAEYKFSDLLKLSLGGRYTRDRTSISACTYDTNGGNIPVIDNVYPLLIGVPVNLQPNQCYVLTANAKGFVNGDIQRNQTQTNFAWRANVDITPNPTTLFYGTISRGYKAGGFPVLAASNEVQFNAVSQERLTAYEVGTKLNLFNRKFQLNLSGFYYDYVNKQIFVRINDIVFTTLDRIDNVPKSREFGVEGDVALRVSPVFTLRAAGVYLDSKIQTYTGFDELGKQTNFAGRPFQYTPKFQGNASANMDAPISPYLHLTGSLDVTYQTDSHADLAGAPLYVIKSYAVAGGSLGIATRDQLSVALYVRNMFDKYYWTGVSSATETVFRYAGLPREFGIRAAFKF